MPRWIVARCSAMGDYGQLESLAVKAEKTADYTFYDVPGQPVLRCVHAGEANKRYWNEVLRRAEQLNRRKVKLSVESVRDNRDRDRDLFPKYVVKDWPKAPLDKTGKQNPFSQEEVAAFLRAVPDYMFDEFREWARDAANFVDVIDGEGAAGNSPTV